MFKIKSKSMLFFFIGIIILVCIVVFVRYEGFTDASNNYFSECGVFSDCKSCSNSSSFCVWCNTTEKCVSDLSSNQLCPRETTVSTSSGCSQNSESSNDTSGNRGSSLYGDCSAATDCSSCMSTPDCSWCSNQNICASSVNLYSQCGNNVYDPSIYNSRNQCELQASLSSTSTSTSTSTTASTSTYSGESVIPTVGVSRTAEGLLTETSLQTIIDSLKSRGHPITDTTSKNAVLKMIQDELTFYNSKYKSDMNTFVKNSMNYVADGTSLTRASNDNTRIQDLKDISRHISAINVSSFTEAYQDLDKEKTLFSYEVTKNKAVKSNIQLFMIANLVVLGSLFFI